MQFERSGTAGWMLARVIRLLELAGKHAAQAGSRVGASILAVRQLYALVRNRLVLHCECYDRNGSLKWRDTIQDFYVPRLATGLLLGAAILSFMGAATLLVAGYWLLGAGAAALGIVVTEGLNDILDKYFKGSGYTAAWYVGLVDNAGFTAYAPGDNAAGITTDASGANQWGEATEYDEATRPVLTLGAVSGGSVDNSASKAEFTISATITIRGAFIVSTNTKAGTGGVLSGEADFTGGSRALVDNDVLRVQATLTQASA